jgi:lysozyme family protein
MLYRAQYWAPIAGDELPRGVDLLVFDCAVNQGPHRAAEILQTALALEHPGIRIDGAVGPETIGYARRYANAPTPLIVEIAAQRAHRYALTTGFDRYGLGWCRRLFRMTAGALQGVK